MREPEERETKLVWERRGYDEPAEKRQKAAKRLAMKYFKHSWRAGVFKKIRDVIRHSVAHEHEDKVVPYYRTRAAYHRHKEKIIFQRKFSKDCHRWRGRSDGSKEEPCYKRYKRLAAAEVREQLLHKIKMHDRPRKAEARCDDKKVLPEMPFGHPSSVLQLFSCGGRGAPRSE